MRAGGVMAGLANRRLRGVGGDDAKARAGGRHLLPPSARRFRIHGGQVLMAGASGPTPGRARRARRQSRGARDEGDRQGRGEACQEAEASRPATREHREWFEQPRGFQGRHGHRQFCVRLERADHEPWRRGTGSWGACMGEWNRNHDRLRGQRPLGRMLTPSEIRRSSSRTCGTIEVPVDFTLGGGDEWQRLAGKATSGLTP